MEDEGLLNKWLGCLSRDGSALETVGNRVQLFFEGDDAFREMWEAIEGAEHYVHSTTCIALRASGDVYVPLR